MTRMVWGASGARFYETGLDRGVLYVTGQPGVPWNGLTSVTETAVGGVAQPYYIDGEKYSNTASREEFEATLTAFTYPDEFAPCDGIVSVRTGLLATQQNRQSFSLCYRTMVGNDLSGTSAYKIHLIYNVLASPSDRDHKTLTDSSDPDDFSWTLTSLPPSFVGYTRTSHFILDSRTLDPTVLSAVEDILYGNDESSPSLPSLSDLTDLIDSGATLILVDNGDGTFTMTAPLDDLEMLDGSIFQLSWPTATFIDDETYTITTA